jgi:hypothetical protein
LAFFLNVIGAFDLLEHLVGTAVLRLAGVRVRLIFLPDGLQSEADQSLS